MPFLRFVIKLKEAEIEFGLMGTFASCFARNNCRETRDGVRAANRCRSHRMRWHNPGALRLDRCQLVGPEIPNQANFVLALLKAENLTGEMGFDVHL